MKMYFLYVILGIGLIIWAFWYDNTDFKPKQKKNGKMTRPYHKRWWLWTIAVILVVGGIGNILGMDDEKQTVTLQRPSKPKRLSLKSIRKLKR